MNGPENFIADASVGLAWVHPGQATPNTNELLESLKGGRRFLVPSLWFVEVANALLVLERRGKLRSDEHSAALRQLDALPFSTDLEGHLKAFREISMLAKDNFLSVYDATYLELAMRERLPLATEDEALRNAAARCGVTLSF